MSQRHPDDDVTCVCREAIAEGPQCPGESFFRTKSEHSSAPHTAEEREAGPRRLLSAPQGGRDSESGDAPAAIHPYALPPPYSNTPLFLQVSGLLRQPPQTPPPGVPESSAPTPSPLT
eukprot:2494452-Rhodomonas_salina.1